MNEFNQITEFEEKQVTHRNITLLLELLKEVKEQMGLLKEGQKQIREDLRNIDKLRALKK